MRIQPQRLWVSCLVFVSSLCGLAVLTAPALAVRQHIFSTSFGSSGAGNGQLSEPVGVAVDESTGDVYVVDRANNRVEYFSSAGAYEGQFDASGSNVAVEGSAAPTGQLSGPRYIAIDNHAASPSFGDVYVVDSGHDVIDKFSSSGHYIGQLTETSPGSKFNPIVGIAVDSSGSLFVEQRDKEVAQFSAAEANEFVSSRELQFFASADPGFAVDSQDNFYAETAFDGPEKFENSGKLLIEHLNSLRPESSTGTDAIALDLSKNEIYIGDADGEGSIGSFSSTGKLLETFGSEQLATGSAAGIAIDSASGDAFVTDSIGDRVNVYTPQPAGPPTIEDESASGVGSGAATLQAQIKPTGPDTSYYFQYGTQSCAAAAGSCVDMPAPPGVDLGEGFEGLSVSALAKGLAPATTYHYRVVAVNELGTSDGVEETLTTQATGTAFALPDGRTWEMVTPPNKLGADIIALGYQQGDDIQASVDGSAITYGTTAPIANDVAGASDPEIQQAVSTRRAPGVWNTTDIMPPHTAGSWTFSAGHAAAYKLFSSDLSLAFLEPPEATALPPLPASAEQTVYERHNGECEGNPSEPPPTCYQALVSQGNVPAGTKLGFEGVKFVNATPDFSHVVMDSSVPLTSAPGDNGGSYVWAAGSLTWVGGQVPLGSRHVISNDGSRVIVVGHMGNPGLYLEDVTTGDSVRVDAAQGAPEPGEDRTLYVTANASDTRVFFTSSQPLTADATTGFREDLYEFELTSGEGQALAGRLTDLTVDGNAGENADVNGVIGASEDGSYVYFVANGVLGDGAQRGAKPGNCEIAREPFRESCSLYVEHLDQASGTWEAPVFIGALSGADQPSWGGPGGVFKSLIPMSARVSPDGRYLAFMSQKSLTGYENRDAESNVPDQEVFLYDAATNKLICASCNPTGARPVGILKGKVFDERLVSYTPSLWEGHWLAANVPGFDTMDVSNAVYQPRYLSNSGRLFFNSSDALVPADVNGTEDVYEYEPAGVGSCKPPTYGQGASIVYSEAMGGCVGLISAGTSSEESAFMEASESGGDVFFLTLSKLSAQDFDTSLDIYDAHECTGASPCAPAVAPVPPPCTSGEACKPAPSPQPALFGSPASETFSGKGDLGPSTGATARRPKPLTRAQKLARALRACRREPRRRRAACERAARSRYGSAAQRRGAKPGKRSSKGRK